MSEIDVQRTRRGSSPPTITTQDSGQDELFPLTTITFTYRRHRTGGKEFEPTKDEVMAVIKSAYSLDEHK